MDWLTERHLETQYVFVQPGNCKVLWRLETRNDFAQWGPSRILQCFDDLDNRHAQSQNSQSQAHSMQAHEGIHSHSTQICLSELQEATERNNTCRQEKSPSPKKDGIIPREWICGLCTSEKLEIKKRSVYNQGFSVPQKGNA